MNAFTLVRADTGDVYDIPAGAALVLGRGVDCDIHINDATLSRRHAEIERTAEGLSVRDLNSSNGTFVGVTRVPAATLSAGETIRFGSVPFRVERTAVGDAGTGDRGPTFFDEIILSQRSVRVPAAARPSEGTVVMASPSAAQELTQRKLALLLEVSTALGRAGSIDMLLEQITDYVFQTMDVDRMSIQLREEDGSFVSHVARDRQGSDTARVVPRSIARKVVDEKIAVISANAQGDDRFSGESIVMQSVRSAMCAPLIGMEGIVLGVLYVDNLTAVQRFSDDDLAFLVAFCGIAAVAIENSHYAERIQREALARGNFERFFTPALAARIAASREALKLGGEKRRVAILFSDIRGFTPMAERMAPEELAALLSEYFTAMVECVFRHGGTLDKFIGDAVMAQWGAPVSADNDADRALAAALDMQFALRQLNARLLADARMPLEIGIGLNAGEVFAGYVGSERRMEYTILGDAVNIASRLCSNAAPGEVLVSDDFLRAIRARPPVTERSGLALKGKTQPVGVFAVTLPRR